MTYHSLVPPSGQKGFVGLVIDAVTAVKHNAS